MTYRQTIKRRWWIFGKKSYRYDLLLSDKENKYSLESEKMLMGTELDILFEKIIHLGTDRGTLNTSKGKVKFFVKINQWKETDK